MAAQDVLATQITIGAVSAYALKYLEGSRYFPWINKETKVISKLVASFLAALGAVGVAYTWDPNAHSLTITGLSLTGIALAAWVFAKQYVIQHLTSQVMYPPSPAEASKAEAVDVAKVQVAKLDKGV